MALNDTLYQADFTLPELIEQGRDNVIACTVYRDDAKVIPSAGTVSVYNEANTAVIDAQSATIASDGTATYTVTDANTSSESLGEGWRVVWSLTIDSVARTFDNDAALVRRRLFPAVTHGELYKRAPSLDPAGSPIHDDTDFQDELDASWQLIEQRLIAAGRRPWLVVSPSALRIAHLELWLSYIFEGLGHRLDPRYLEIGQTHRDRFEAEWAKVRLLYDSDDDGRADDPYSRQGATGTLWTC